MDVKSNALTEAGFNELWREYEPYIRKLCAYRLKSMPHTVDDCVQEVFKALLDTMNKGTAVEHPKAWLTAVAGNKINDFYSSATKEAAGVIPLSHGDVEGRVGLSDVLDAAFQISDEQIETIKSEVLRELSDEERIFINEYYVQKIKLKVMAENHRLSESKMKKTMFYLRKKIVFLSKSALNRQAAQNRE